MKWNVKTASVWLLAISNTVRLGSKFELIAKTNDVFDFMIVQYSCRAIGVDQTNRALVAQIIQQCGESAQKS